MYDKATGSQSENQVSMAVGVMDWDSTLITSFHISLTEFIYKNTPVENGRRIGTLYFMIISERPSFFNTRRQDINII